MHYFQGSREHRPPWRPQKYMSFQIISFSQILTDIDIKNAFIMFITYSFMLLIQKKRIKLYLSVCLSDIKIHSLINILTVQ